jgi:hypothetical protein
MYWKNNKLYFEIAQIQFYAVFLKALAYLNLLLRLKCAPQALRGQTDELA